MSRLLGKVVVNRPLKTRAGNILTRLAHRLAHRLPQRPAKHQKTKSYKSQRTDHSSNISSSKSEGDLPQVCKNGGAKRSRTADLLIANETLYQLSYSPIPTLIMRKGLFAQGIGKIASLFILCRLIYSVLL